MGASVLLLEDDAAIRELLEIALADDGHNVHVCESPEQVIHRAREIRQALAVVDFWGESQLVLTEEERAEVVRLADAVPTILVTGRRWAEHHPAGDLGVLDIIGKPFDLAKVSGLIAAWVANLKQDSAEARAQGQHLRLQMAVATERLRALRADLARLADEQQDPSLPR
jgi:two-component system phosphate regulon response regulator PhoB